MKKLSENLLLGSRYILVPLYFGLIVYMALYNLTFFGALWETIKEFMHHSGDLKELGEILKLAALDAVDSAMIANLILMISIGSQSIFVNEIESKEGKLPRFLNKLSSGILKLKMATSLVGVTAVHLLVSFVNVDKIGWDNLFKESFIHSLFIISAFVFAKIEVMIHPSKQEEAH